MAECKMYQGTLEYSYKTNFVFRCCIDCILDIAVTLLLWQFP